MIIYSKYKGIPTEGLDFYHLIYDSNEFCAELGRAVLAAGRLESALICFLEKNSGNEMNIKSTLGQLIGYAREHKLLERMIPALETVKVQRNYLSHNIHALLSGRIEETILERSDLLDSDVSTYTERAWQLKENINGLADILEKNIA